MPWAKDPSLKATTDFVQRSLSSQKSKDGSEFPMVILHNEDSKIIGMSGYKKHSNFEQGLYEIGYWCDIDYQGKGYVTESVNALTRYTFTELGAKKVLICTDVDNTRSIAVAKRLNFIEENIIGRRVHFTCHELQALPPLDISWSYKE